MSQNKLRSTKRPGRLALLTLTPIMAAMLTGAPISASAAAVSASVKYDKKLDVVVVTGKTDKTITANSKVSVYDTANQVLLYTINTNSTGKFKFNLPTTGGDYVPCSVRVETVNAKDNTQSKVVLPVAGSTSCATSVACAISKPLQDTEITVGSSVDFAATIKGKKGNTPTIVWKLGDGSADQKTNLVNHKFDQVGRYRVTLNAVDTNGLTQCSDDVIVSVIPPATVNPGKVTELAKPGIAAAMPKADGTNDKDAYVVLPFEEMGMQGGSQVHLPYNAMINYNSLNAQVIQKKEHKPPIVTNTGVEVTYSAASNANDPIAKDSINSTSQNLFSDGDVGANYDPVTTIYDATSKLPTDLKFIEGHDYNQAIIRKTEQWDRLKQPFAAATGTKQTGTAFAERQSTFTPAKPAENPDEGVRGYVDNGAGNRKMPGAANPYIANDPQKLDFNSYQDAFVAQFIPASDIDDKGRTNPYPLLRVQAKTKTGETLATTDAVYTTASETRCRECHTPGGIAADEAVWRTPVTEDELKDLKDPSKPGPATGAGNFDPGNDANKPWPPAIHNRFDNKHPDTVLGMKFAKANEAVLDTETWKATWSKAYTVPTDYVSTVEVYGANLAAPPAFVIEKAKVKGKDVNILFTNEAGVVLRYNRKAFNNLGVTLDPTKETSATNIKTDLNGLRTDRVKASRWAKFDAATGKPTGETKPTKPDGAGPEWRLQIQLNFADASKYGDDSWVNQEKGALFNTLIMHDYMVLYGPTPSVGNSWPGSYSTQVADSYADDVGSSRAQPMYFCSGHHQSHLKSDVGVTARSYATNRSDYSRAFHAFHGKMQVYRKDVTAAESADGLAHKKGELIRDERGHPKEYGGRGWDSQLDDDNGVPLSKTADVKNADGTVTPGTFTIQTVPTYDAKKNNWRPDLFPMDPNGESMLPFGKQVPVEENCAKCHTGPTEKSYRDIHHTAGLKCDSCHGDMLAVGNVFYNEKYDANLTGGGAYGLDTGGKIEPADYRRPWLDEPNCGSCHFGDANMHKTDAHLFSAAAKDQAWADGDKSGYTLDPMNARFAVMPTLEKRPEKATVNGSTVYAEVALSGALYRKSADVHGSSVANGVLTCSTCHGGSHAIWPNQDPNANDNQTAKQLQGYDGNIAECSVCHIKDDFKTGLVATDGGDKNLGVAQGVREGSTVVTPFGLDVNGKPGKNNKAAYLAGPHGLHPIGDEYWYKHAEGAAANESAGKHNLAQNGGWHNDMAGKPGPDGEDQCAACHGDDHKGTRLSKTLVDRVLTNEKGKAVKVVKGQIIGCDLCHSLKKSFANAPDPKSSTGGWPAAKHHMPPAPTSITAGSTAGGGGGHGGHGG